MMAAVMISVVFNMGTDLASILDSNIGQPMAVVSRPCILLIRIRVD